MEAKPVLHTLKFLVPTLGLVVVLTYGLFDQLRNFVFGIFIPQYHYPYSVALSFAQVGVSPPGILIFSWAERGHLLLLNSTVMFVCLLKLKGQYVLLLVLGRCLTRWLVYYNLSPCKCGVRWECSSSKVSWVSVKWQDSEFRRCSFIPDYSLVNWLNQIRH